MSGTPAAKPAELNRIPKAAYGAVGVGGGTVPGMNTNIKLDPKDPGMQNKLFQWMVGDRTKQYKMAENTQYRTAALQGGKLGAETLSNTLNSVFTHVGNMEQLKVYSNFVNKQHDIARRSIGLESKKLDVQKEMHNEQLRFQLKVAQHQKETTVTVAAIQEKGKTKRVQALAALRTVYGRGKPVSPFQRQMS